MPGASGVSDAGTNREFVVQQVCARARRQWRRWVPSGHPAPHREAILHGSRLVSVQRAEQILVNNESPGVGRSCLKRFCADSCYGFMMRFIESLQIDARKEHKLFIARFYTQAIISVLIEWFETGMKQTPEEMIRLNEIAMKGSIREALLRSTRTP